MSDRVTLTDYEARRLLNAIVKEFVQMTAEELEQQASEGNRYGLLILFIKVLFIQIQPVTDTREMRTKSFE